MDKGERYPGEPAFWGFVAIDVLLFSFLFLAALYYRQSASLSADTGGTWQVYGLVNAVILILSSGCVATGVGFARNGDGRRTAIAFGVAAVCGCLFFAIKVYEYHKKLAVGLGPNSSDTLMYYFTVTGLHLFHLTVGTLLLIGITSFYWQRSPGRSGIMVIECVAVFWHVVDLLWIFIFALFYLIP